MSEAKEKNVPHTTNHHSEKLKCLKEWVKIITAALWVFSEHTLIHTSVTITQRYSTNRKLPIRMNTYLSQVFLELSIKFGLGKFLLPLVTFSFYFSSPEGSTKFKYKSDDTVTDFFNTSQR